MRPSQHRTGPGTPYDGASDPVTLMAGPPVAGPLARGGPAGDEQLAVPSGDIPVRGHAGWREVVVVGLLMLGAAIAFFHGAWVHPSSNQIGPGGDADEYAWFLAWVPYAIGHGLDPLISTYVNAPHGVNLMWNTSALLPAFVASPFTVVFDAAFSYNLLMTTAPALTGLFCYIAFRRWATAVPALAGALVSAFSPYLFSQAYGHLAQTVLVSAPLLLIVLDRLLVVQRAPAWKDGLALGLLVWAQLLTGEEVLAMEVLAAVVGTVVTVALRRRDVLSRWRHAGRGLIVAAVSAGALSSPFLAVQFLGPYQVQNAHPPNVFVTDLFNFFVPTAVTKIVPGAAATIASGFTGNVSEQGGYIGVPMLLFLLAALVMARRRTVAWVAAVTGAATALLSMGPTLHWEGHVSHLLLPYYVLDRLPLFHNLLADRFASMTTIMMGLLLAIGCEELRRRRVAVRLSGAALVLTGMAALFPTTSFPAAASPRYQAFVSGLSCPSRLPGASSPPVALVVPATNEMDLRWQSEAGFCFAMPSDTGMTGTNSAVVGHLNMLVGLGRPGQPMLPTTPAARARAAGLLRRLHVSEIVVGPEWPAVPGWSPQGQANAVAWVQWLLGTKPVQSQDPYISYIWRSLPPNSEIASGSFPPAG